MYIVAAWESFDAHMHRAPIERHDGLAFEQTNAIMRRIADMHKQVYVARFSVESGKPKPCGSICKM